MESSRWGSLSSCVQQQLWSQRQPEIREDDDCSSLGGNVDLVDNLFNSGHDIQGHKSSNLASDFGSANGIIQELAPAIDSIIVGSNLNLFQRQEAMRLAKSGAGSGTTWGKALTGGELCSPLINRLYSNTPLSSLMPGVDKLQVPTTGMQVDTLGVSADSLESLDCLLSASNSNTDTSVEDDGISMLFSECKSIWNFNSSGAISSGESENNRKASKPEENVSKSYTNPSDTRPSSSKRAKEREEVKTSVNYRHFDIFQSDSSTTEGGFKLISENPSKLKKPRLEKQQKTSNINFQQPYSSISSSIDEPDTEAIAQVKEMIYRAAVLRPVSLDLDVVEKPKRKNVKISSDPQTVAARQRRERISERIRILQRLVPGGNKMDTASMLDEAANYLKFLRSQIKALEAVGHNKFDSMNTTINLPYPSFPFNNQNFPMQPFFPFSKP